MDPVPAVYSVWYRETEICLGQTGDFEALTFFVADEITMLDGYTETEWAVRHEFVHHITGWSNAAHAPNGHLPCEGR